MDAATAESKELKPLTEWVDSSYLYSKFPDAGSQHSLTWYIDYDKFGTSNRVIRYPKQQARLRDLRKAWTEETKDCESRFASDPNAAHISKIADEVLTELSKIEFKDAAVELSPFDAIKITLILRQEPELLLIVTRPFENLVDVQGDQVVFSIFNQDDHISDVLPLSALVEGIRSFLAKQATAEGR